MDWFTLALISTLMFGVQGFLFKKSTEMGCNKFIVTLAMMITVEILSVFVFLFSKSNIAYLLPTLLLGFLFAAFFYTKTIMDLKALEYLPTNKVFPITTSNAVLVVIYAIVFFNERLSPSEVLGIIVIITSIVLIHHNSKKQVDYSKAKIGFLIAIIAILPGAGMKIVNKYAADSSDTIAFTVITYLFLVLVSSFSYKVSSKIQNYKYKSGNSITLGILIGLVNFAGFYSHLFALKSGKLAVISTIHASYIIVSVLLAKLFCNEALSKKQFALVLLSVTGVILLKVNPNELIESILTYLHV